MQCINHFGGYLCLPKSAVIYISQEGGEQVPDPAHIPVPAIPPSQPQPVSVYPSGRRGPRPGWTITCSPGFAADEQNVCRGEIKPPVGLEVVFFFFGSTVRSMKYHQSTLKTSLSFFFTASHQHRQLLLSQQEVLTSSSGEKLDSETHKVRSTSAWMAATLTFFKHLPQYQRRDAWPS